MPEENLTPRVSNLETLMEYMAQTQRELSANQGVLTAILQRQDDRLNNQDEEIKLLRQIIQRHDESIVVMQGQIRLLLERLLGNS